MSDATYSTFGQSGTSEGAVRRLISDVRARIRKYYALSGALLLFSAAAAAYWVTTIADSGWFALQRLELPVGLRVIVLGVILLGGGWLLIQHLLQPLFRGTKDSELALLLERRFPEFQDRLITAVEAQQGFSETGAITQQMLQQTVNQAESVAARVSPPQIFDPLPLKLRGWIAAICLLSVVGSAVASPGSLQRWWNAFVLCEESYHQRDTQLEFTVIAPPDNRRISFRSTETGPLYLHPLGADLELEISVPDIHLASGRPCVVPDQVRVDVRRFDGSRSRTYLTSAGGRTFRFVLTRLQESVAIEVLGGDFRTPVPLQIESVTPPGLDTIQADCDYPAYTKLNEQRESVVPVLSREVSLPIGTAFKLSVTANKSLLSARISTDLFDVEGDQSTSRIIPRAGYNRPILAGGPLIGEDGRTLSASFQISPTVPPNDESAPDARQSKSAAPGELSDADNTEKPDEANSAGLPIPPNSTLKFYLHDTDNIKSAAPEVLRLRGIPDKPPVIAVRKHGVGNAITRRAIIPMRGVIKDDYGLTGALFRFIVDDETQWRPRPFRNVFKPKREYDLEDVGGPGSEYFRVEELDLTDGQTLALTILATDGCTIPKPNTTQAEPAVFRIVSPEELLSLLYSRELNQRGRFEDVIVALTRIQEDLTFHLDIARRIEAADVETASPEDLRGLSGCARESGDSLRRQNNELKSIIESFEEIRAELINNSISPKERADDMKYKIIDPLQNVRTGLLDKADRSVSRFRVAATSGKPSAAVMTESIEDVTNTIVRLREILENVRDMAEFHELYQEGKYIYEDILKLWEQTKELQRKRAIEKLKLLE